MKKNFLCRWLFLLAFVPVSVFAGSSVTTPDPKLYSDAMHAVIASTATGKGSALVGHIPQGTSAVPATVQGKLGEVVSVKDKGAVGDGVADDTAAISAALAASKSVYFPTGIYLINSSISLQTGSRLHGDGIDKTILRYTSNARARAMLNADSGSSSAYLIGVEVRDMTLDGMSDKLGFSQFVHLLGFNGVKNAVVEGVKFRAPRGDGLLVGSGLSGGVERHNVSVTVRNNIFDGINKTNRNGISVIDCNGLTVENNEFRNLTSARMPGPIDVEPENAYNVVKSIKIRGNRFYNNGGGQLIGVYTSATVLTNPISDIEFSGNYFDSSNSHTSTDMLVRTKENLSTVPDMGVKIFDNVSFTTTVPLALVNVNGADIFKNTSNGGSTTVLGDATTAAVTLANVKYHENRLNGSSNSVGCITVGSVNHLEIYRNTMSPKGANTHAITFIGSGVTTTSSGVTIAENIFDKAAAQTDMVYVYSHKLTPASNIWRGNIEKTRTLTSAFTYNTGK